MQTNSGFQFLILTLILKCHLWNCDGIAKSNFKDQDIQQITLQHLLPETDAFGPTSWVEAEQ
ncbi:MAG: hypothetical protein IBJ00_05835, partial [Alphaproteobacteria bacterium]|nr:hypothetical protein [Alphaproteobacteria bacterium]